MHFSHVDAHAPQAGLILKQTFPFLASLDRYYPGIASWFESSFSTGFLRGDNHLIVAFDTNERIAGIALGKKTLNETKMQCVRVAEPSVHSGLGIALMDRMIEVLQCERPLATVSEEMLHQYSRIFIKRYGFSLDDVVKGTYRQGKLEYCFNGTVG